MRSSPPLRHPPWTGLWLALLLGLLLVACRPESAPVAFAPAFQSERRAMVHEADPDPDARDGTPLGYSPDSMPTAPSNPKLLGSVSGPDPGARLTGYAHSNAAGQRVHCSR